MKKRLWTMSKWFLSKEEKKNFPCSTGCPTTWNSRTLHWSGNSGKCWVLLLAPNVAFGYMRCTSDALTSPTSTSTATPSALILSSAPTERMKKVYSPRLPDNGNIENIFPAPIRNPTENIASLFRFWMNVTYFPSQWGSITTWILWLQKNIGEK